MNADYSITRWWWVRHAPVTVNEGKIYGQTDLPCDCSDSRLFEHAASVLPHPAVLITSDLQRTLQTAEAIAKAGYGDMPPPIQDEALREQNFGDWQGMTREQIGIYHRALNQRFWLTPEFEAAPNGESFSDLCARVTKSILTHSNDYRGKDIICVAHNGTIRAALLLALGSSFSTAMGFVIDNVSVTRLDYICSGEQSFWQVCCINDVAGSCGWKHTVDHSGA